MKRLVVGADVTDAEVLLHLTNFLAADNAADFNSPAAQTTYRYRQAKKRYCGD